MGEDTNLKRSTRIRDELQSLSFGQFKRFVSAFWEWEGYTVEQTDDGDEYDLVISRENPYPEKNLIKIEHKGDDITRVPVGPIENLNSLRENDKYKDIDKLFVVTSGTYTEWATKTSRRLNVKTITGEQLVRMVYETGSQALFEEFDLIPPEEEEKYRLTILVGAKAGDPIKDATITIEDDRGILDNVFILQNDDKTDGNGRVEAEVPNGQYTVTATHEDFEGEAEREVEITDRDETITLSLSRSGGPYQLLVVVKTENGEPVEKATVTVRDEERALRAFSGGRRKGTTNSDGVVRGELRGGQYTVTASHEDFNEKIEKDLEVDRDREIMLIGETTLSELTVTVESESGNPIQGSIVTIRDTEGSPVEAFDRAEQRETDENGEVKAKLPSGRYTVSATHKEADDEVERAVEVDGVSEEVSLVLESSTYPLSITVRDEDDNPVTGALVTVRDRDRNLIEAFENGKVEGETDSRGEITAEVPAGQYVITAGHEDFSGPIEDDMEVTSGESVVLAFTTSEDSIRSEKPHSSPKGWWKRAIKINIGGWILAIPLFLIETGQFAGDDGRLAAIPGLLFLLLWLSAPLLLSIDFSDKKSLISWLVLAALYFLLPGPISEVATLPLLIVLWISLPLLIYLDSKAIIKRIGWPVYRLNYVVLSAVWFINIPVALLYLRRRRKAWNRNRLST